MRLRYWSEANIARDQGRIARALSLYAKATAVSPSPEASYEAGNFALDVSHGVAGLRDLYQRHRRSFGLSVEECHDAVLKTLLGQEGLQFGIDRLTQANAFPGVPVEWHELMADVLAARGQLHQALQWRRLAHRRDPARHANQLAIAGLCEALGMVEDAARAYDRILDRWPGDPDAILALTGIRERSGTGVDEARLVELFKAAWREPSPGNKNTEHEAADLVACRLLQLVWAVARRGSRRMPAEARQRLPILVQKLAASHPHHPATHLAEGYMAWIDGHATVARQKFLATSLAIASGAVLKTGSPECDAALDEAVQWARVLVTDSGARLLPESRRPVIDTAALERAHARETWATDGMLTAMPMYSASLRLHYVRSVPLQYEIRGDYKVLWHEGLFYAVPRRVSEFTIIDGRVFRLKGRARSSRQPLPPRLLDLAYRLRALRRAALATMALRQLARLGRFAGSTWLRRMASRATRLSWMRYGVRGVLVATTSQELFALIDRDSNNPRQAFAVVPGDRMAR